MKTSAAGLEVERKNPPFEKRERLGRPQELVRPRIERVRYPRQSIRRATAVAAASPPLEYQPIQL